MIKSWKTTLMGVGAFLTALIPALMAQFDGVAETAPNWETVIVAAMAMFGLAAARDNDVTSEQAGVKK